MSERDTLTEDLWKFVRGDTAPAAFEQWICTTPELEQVLGPRLYLQAISASYREHDEVDAVRAEIESFLVTCRPAACACLEMRDLHVVMMGSHERLFRTLAEVKRHGDPLWWLHLERCTECRQYWLVAAEERQNDVFCLRRLSDARAERVLAGGEWPTEFHAYETLIRLGIDANIVFHFVDPMDARWTIALLAEQRPGIRVSEIAKLVALDVETAAIVARETARLHGVKITFDA